MGAQATRTEIHGVWVQGHVIDGETRCRHWHGPLDVIAIRFKCCDGWFPCYTCHEVATDHSARRWNLDEHDTAAVLCGVCGHQLTIAEYLNSSSRCSACQSAFNPGCALHHHLYFEVH